MTDNGVQLSSTIDSVKRGQSIKDTSTFKSSAGNKAGDPNEKKISILKTESSWQNKTVSRFIFYEAAFYNFVI